MALSTQEEKSVNFSVLPPCRICGDKASGFHYGANTCEACKGFYRRAAIRGHLYKCKKNKQCVINSGKKASCTYCRYQKCLAVGMDRNCIRRGRYTLAERTKCITEVKGIQQTIEGAADVASKPEDPTEPIQRLIGYITELHQLHLAQVINPSHVEMLHRKRVEYAEQRRELDALCGSIAGLDQESFNRLYSQTGIDIDGRLGVIKSLLPIMEKSLLSVIAFLKAVPGFKSLTTDDQIALLKANNFFWRVFHMPVCVDVETKCFSSVDGTTFMTKDEIHNITGDEICDSFFDTTSILQKIDLTDTELVLLKMICLFSVDECSDLDDRSQIERLQWEYMEALQFHIEVTNNGSLKRMAQCLLLMTQLRTADALFKRNREKILQIDALREINVPQLIYEMVSI